MYALNLYFSSLSHVIKSETFISNIVRDLLNIPSYEEAVAYLKSKGLISTTSLDIEDVEISLKDYYIKVLQKLSGYSSPDRDIKDLIDLYKFRILVNEYKSIITAVYNGVRVNEKLGTFNPFSSVVKEKINSLEELKNLIAEPRFRDSLDFALSSGKSLRNILNSIDLYFAKYLYQYLSKNNEIWVKDLWNIYCGYFDYYSIIVALELKSRESLLLSCKIPDEFLENLRTGEDIIGNLTRIGVLLGLEVKSNDVMEILEMIKDKVRRESRRRALEVNIKASPSTPLILISTLELLYLDFTDIERIINSLNLRKSTDYIKKIVSLMP